MPTGWTALASGHPGKDGGKMIGGGEDVSPLEIRAPCENRLKVNESASMGIPEQKRGLPLYQAATPFSVLNNPA
jgi:hypothetical protein